jgi:DNA-binding HxlR family transcriptional regulator
VPTKRSYAELGDACRAANALDLVGDRWTLIVVRELILGPKRFADLLAAVRGITPAVLADRLRSMQQAGLVEQVTLPDLARTRAYAATEWGRGLEPVLASLGRWYSAGPGLGAPGPRTPGGVTPDATVIAMRTMAPPPPGDLAPVTLRLYDARRPDPPVRDYRVAAAGGVLAIEAGAAGAAATGTATAATVTAESTVWSEVLFGGLPLRRAERAGTVRVQDDRDAVARLVGLYA